MHRHERWAKHLPGRSLVKERWTAGAVIGAMQHHTFFDDALPSLLSVSRSRLSLHWGFTLTSSATTCGIQKCPNCLVRSPLLFRPCRSWFSAPSGSCGRRPLEQARVRLGRGRRADIVGDNVSDTAGMSADLLVPSQRVLCSSPPLESC